MRPRTLILIAAVLGAASPAAASFTGHAEHAGSAARAAGVFRPVPGSPPPAVTSAARFGETLTATTGGWLRQPSSFALRWLRCDAGGAACRSTQGASTVTAGEIGHRLRVEVTARNAGGSAVATSPASQAVPPESKARGTIGGTPTVGSVLSFTSGGWTLNPDLPSSLRREWWRCPTADWSPTACVRLPTVAATYAPVAADVGAHLRVLDVAEQGGAVGEVVSAAAGPVSAASARLAATAQHATAPAYGWYTIDRIADPFWDTDFLTEAGAGAVRAGQWVGLDFGAARTLTRYRIDHRVYALSGHATFAYAIEASTDGVSWTALRLPSPVTAPRHLSNGDVTLPAPVRGRYLRMRALTDPGMGWQVYGLEGWGY